MEHISRLNGMLMKNSIHDKRKQNAPSSFINWRIFCERTAIAMLSCLSLHYSRKQMQKYEDFLE